MNATLILTLVATMFFFANTIRFSHIYKIID